MNHPIIQRLRQFRSIEFRLLFTVLLFFAAGYLLVVFVRQPDFTRTVPGILSILWPSTLPLLLFIGVSLGLSWRAPSADQILLPLVALLAGLGLLLNARLKPSLDNILCEASDGSMVSCYGDVAAKQSLWVTLGVVVLAIMIFVPWDRIFIRFQRTSLMDWFDHHRYAWLSLGLALTLATFFFGVDPNQSGVRVWFNLGLFYFQPSELLKIILVIFLASYLEEHRAVVAANYRFGPLKLPPLPHLIPIVGMWGIAMSTIVFQSDLGAALLLFGVFLAMLYIATGRGLYVLSGLLAFVVGAVILYNIVAVVKLRVAVWLDPWATAQGTGYQIVQAIYALASGGILGRVWAAEYPPLFPPFIPTSPLPPSAKSLVWPVHLGYSLCISCSFIAGITLPWLCLGDFADSNSSLQWGLRQLLPSKPL